MDVLNNKTLRRSGLIIAIVLIPIWLTELFLPRAKAPSGPAPSRSVEAPKAMIPLAPEPRIDRERFLLSFTRQAATRLDSCLRESLGSTGSITLMARLNKKGLLTGSRVVEPRGLDCAVDALREMRFEAVGRSLDRESAEIAWRYDF